MPRTSSAHASTGGQHWLVRPSTIRWLWRGGGAVLAVITLLSLTGAIHGRFGYDETFGFHSWFGFLSCAAMVILAKGLGVFLKRPEGYYDRGA